MRVRVHGRAAHGSMPQAAVDPVALAAMIVIRLQTIVSREIGPTEPAVLTTEELAAAFSDFFGDDAGELPLQSAGEDFGDIPTALGIPYSYWGLGGTDPDAYAAAENAGRVSSDIPVNHVPYFAPVVQPTRWTEACRHSSSRPCRISPRNTERATAFTSDPRRN